MASSGFFMSTPIKQNTQQTKRNNTIKPLSPHSPNNTPRTDSIRTADSIIINNHEARGHTSSYDYDHNEATETETYASGKSPLNLQLKIQAARNIHYFKQQYNDEHESSVTETLSDDMDSDSYESDDSHTTIDLIVDPEPIQNVDYVAIEDMVWQQTIKYYKNRLIHLEQEISRLPSKKMDKLQLYTALEFLSINPYEKKVNPHLMEWFDRYKYESMDKQPDPGTENTLTSVTSPDWNEIGIPRTNEPGNTPTHQNITILEDIYDNLKRSDWIDPVPAQRASVVLDDDDDDSIEGYLMDGNDLLSYLNLQCRAEMMDAKNGLIQYVHYGVDDEQVECALWRLRRVFETCSFNRFNYKTCVKLMLKKDALTQNIEIERKSTQAKIRKLKQQIYEQQASQRERRKCFEEEMFELDKTLVVQHIEIKRLRKKMHIQEREMKVKCEMLKDQNMKIHTLSRARRKHIRRAKTYDEEEILYRAKYERKKKKLKRRLEAQKHAYRMYTEQYVYDVDSMSDHHPQQQKPSESSLLLSFV